MGRKRFSPEQIIVKLREAEIVEILWTTSQRPGRWSKTGGNRYS
jgi:hypothetical protein